MTRERMKSKYDAGRVLGPEFASRVLFAHMLLAQGEGDHITLAEFGERVAKAEGKAEPYSASTVSRWESGTECSFSTILAICKLLKGRIDPGWLAFGDACAVEPPPAPQLTLADFAQARTAGRRGPRR